MNYEAETKVRYYDESQAMTPSGLVIETKLTVNQDKSGYGSRQGVADVPMTFIEKAQDGLRKTVVAAVQEAAKGHQ